jgi:hypothetical protein
MGMVGEEMKARGTLPKSLRQKCWGPDRDLETLTKMLERLDRPNRLARRALEKVTTKRRAQR